MALYLAVLYLTLMPDVFSAYWLELYPLSSDFRVILLILAALNLLCTFIYEQFVVVYFLGKVCFSFCGIALLRA